MIRKVIERTWKKTAAVILVLALAAGAYGCGKSAEPAAKEETAVEESASAQSTVKEPINPEEVKSEEIVKEDAAKEETVKDDTVKEETVPQETDQVQEQASAASTQEEKKEVIEKPEVSEANTEAEKEKEEKKKEEKKEEKPSTQDLNEVLDGVMTFDGMELEFPVELSGMKLGKWTLTYELEGDPAAKTLAYQENRQGGIRQLHRFRGGSDRPSHDGNLYHKGQRKRRRGAETPLSAAALRLYMGNFCGRSKGSAGRGKLLRQL